MTNKLFQFARRRRWPLLIGLAAFGCAAWFLVPQLWAWYHFRAGKSAVERYHSTEALAHLSACLRIWPGDTEAHLLAARAARRAGDFDAAFADLRECQRLEHTPSDATVLERALLRADAGDLESVDEYLIARAAKDPALTPLVLEALAGGCIRSYRYLDASNYLLQWLEAQPDHVQALYLRGTLRQQVGSAEPAAEDFQKVVDLDPERDDARRRLGRCLLKASRFEDALSHLEHLRKTLPHDNELLVDIARCQLELGRRDEARALLEGILEENSAYGPALQERGRLALREGRPAEAEEWLRKAVRATPQDYYANWALYEALRQQGKTAEAQEQLETARKIQDRMERIGAISQHEMASHPSDPALNYELGTLLLSFGNREMAKICFLKAVKLSDDKHAAAHASLADLYREEGDAEQAEYHRKKAEK
jgi:tetratricopeptide (TPR) repeat protein